MTCVMSALVSAESMLLHSNGHMESKVSSQTLAKLCEAKKQRGGVPLRIVSITLVCVQSMTGNRCFVDRVLRPTQEHSSMQREHSLDNTCTLHTSTSCKFVMRLWSVRVKRRSCCYMVKTWHMSWPVRLYNGIADATQNCTANTLLGGEAIFSAAPTTSITALPPALALINFTPSPTSSSSPDRDGNVWCCCCCLCWRSSIARSICIQKHRRIIHAVHVPQHSYIHTEAHSSRVRGRARCPG